MKKQYATLQRNLNEINSKLDRLHALPESKDRRCLADDIGSHLVFVSTLLSAEFSSSSSSADQSNAPQLQHFANRLAQLHADFTGQDHSDIHDVEEDHQRGGYPEAVVDGGSETCSCSDSCFDDDDDDGEGSTEFGTPTAEDSPKSGLTMTENAEVWPEFRASTAEGGGRLRSCCRRMMVIGAVTTVIAVAVVNLSDRSSDFSYLGDRPGYLIPT